MTTSTLTTITTNSSASKYTAWGIFGLACSILSIPLVLWASQFLVAQIIFGIGMIATIGSDIVILCQPKEIQATLAEMNRDIYGKLPLRWFVIIGIVTAFGFMIQGHGILAFLNLITIISVSILYHKLRLY